MATAKTCGPEDQCFITNSNREEILELNCRVLQLNHKLQCCSARAKGDGNTTCLGTGEVTPDQMRFVIEELENSIRKLRDEFSKHLADIQHLRGRRGRAQTAPTDSGIVSWTPPDGTAGTVPIQEELSEEVQVSSTSANPNPREPGEHCESAVSLY